MKTKNQTSTESTPKLDSSSDSSDEENNDFYIPGDSCDQQRLAGSLSTSSYLPEYEPTFVSHDGPKSATSEKQNEENHSDAAAAILEGFFFGGTRATEYSSKMPSGRLNNCQNMKANVATESLEYNDSATSTRMPPFPYGSALVSERQRMFTQSERPATSATADDPHHIPSALILERTTSMPLMPPVSGSPARPRKPILKGTGSSTSLNSSKRNVSFTDVQFREYKVALSQHPSCSFGPPVELGWDYDEKESRPLEDYEVSRSPRREKHELVLSYNVRRLILLKEAGYSKEDLRAAEREVDRVKQSRMVTEMFLPAQVIHEGLENFVDFVKRASKFGNNPACQ